MTMNKLKTTAAVIALVVVLALVTLVIVKGIKYSMIITVSAGVGGAVSAWFTRKYYVNKIEKIYETGDGDA